MLSGLDRCHKNVRRSSPRLQSASASASAATDVLAVQSRNAPFRTLARGLLTTEPLEEDYL